ncbi:hypothetical protein AZE42_02790 [Rhizopogon vesiculosus]|uniref:Uncharacterized protein n=1 Tax=Rhizopogon vesiculosus TaxID=180088 RepID=A0A1J8PT11_9AGAM|nr:hypothetical protein AZE42_02790 [Rhizopogon vesiculosus]
MRKVLGELDNVIGFDHVPEFYDKESLPYVKALIDDPTVAAGRGARRNAACCHTRWRISGDVHT